MYVQWNRGTRLKAWGGVEFAPGHEPIYSHDGMDLYVRPHFVGRIDPGCPLRRIIRSGVSVAPKTGRVHVEVNPILGLYVSFISHPTTLVQGDSGELSVLVDILEGEDEDAVVRLPWLFRLHLSEGRSLPAWRGAVEVARIGSGGDSTNSSTPAVSAPVIEPSLESAESPVDASSPDDLEPTGIPPDLEDQSGRDLLDPPPVPLSPPRPPHLPAPGSEAAKARRRGSRTSHPRG